MATGIAVADLDGDDKPDLIVSNWIGANDRSHGAVGVLIGNGDGTFQPPVSYGSGGYGGSSLAISDVNGDRYQDVAVANCDRSGTQTCTNVGNGAGAVGVLFGNGDGTLRNAVSYDIGGLGAGSVAIADIDGDRSGDILVASCAGGPCTSAVGVLLGNGDGSFQVPVSYESGGVGAGAIGAADLNGDGLPEVLATTCVSPSCAAAVWLSSSTRSGRAREARAVLNVAAEWRGERSRFGQRFESHQRRERKARHDRVETDEPRQHLARHRGLCLADERSAGRPHRSLRQHRSAHLQDGHLSHGLLRRPRRPPHDAHHHAYRPAAGGVPDGLAAA